MNSMTAAFTLRIDEVTLEALDRLAERTDRIAGTRELAVADTPCVVPYRVANGDVQILAVFHGSRRWPDELGQGLTPPR